MQELGYGVLKQSAMYDVVSQSSLDDDSLLAQRIAESQPRSQTELYKRATERKMQAMAEDRALTERIAASEMVRLSRENPALVYAARDFEEELTVDDAVLAQEVVVSRMGGRLDDGALAQLIGRIQEARLSNHKKRKRARIPYAWQVEEEREMEENEGTGESETEAIYESDAETEDEVEAKFSYPLESEYTRCPVCLEDIDGMSTSSTATLNPCAHIMCHSCLEQYLIHAVEEQNKLPIPCPNCRNPLDLSFCLSTLASSGSAYYRLYELIDENTY